MKYHGGTPRGFTVLAAGPETGQMAAGKCTSPRTSRDGSAGIHTRTRGVSVRVGRSTTARWRPSHHAEDVAGERATFLRNCAQVRRSTVCNSHNCSLKHAREANKAYAIHPRGHAPRHSRCKTVDDAVEHGCRPRAESYRSSATGIRLGRTPASSRQLVPAVPSGLFDEGSVPHKASLLTWAEAAVSS